MTVVEPISVRTANPEDEPAIVALVVEGFLDQFIPVFGDSSELSNKIMEKWIKLEHVSGGVRSLVAWSGDEVVASVGVRTANSQEADLSRGLWCALRRNLGPLRAAWATMLLSYPRYAPRSSEAYVERLVVSPGYRNRGMGRELLHRAEDLGREAGKKTVGLHVSGNNEAAIKLYEDEGYIEISRQRSLLTGYFLGIREWLYMNKRL